jgi:hypothetical protein
MVFLWCFYGVFNGDSMSFTGVFTVTYGVLMGYMMVIQWDLMGFNGDSMVIHQSNNC